MLHIWNRKKHYLLIISKWVFLLSKQWLIFQISFILWLPHVLGYILVFSGHQILTLLLFWYISKTYSYHWCQPKVQCSHCLHLKIPNYHVVCGPFFFQLFISYNLLILSIPFFFSLKIDQFCLFTWISDKICLKWKEKPMCISHQLLLLELQARLCTVFQIMAGNSFNNCSNTACNSFPSLHTLIYFFAILYYEANVTPLLGVIFKALSWLFLY